MGTILNKLLLATLLFSSVAASALTLDEGRSRGLIGETLSGYVAVVDSTPEAQALATRINQERTRYYQQIATENNVPVRQVAELAGQKLINRAAKGEYVRGINGQWIKK